MGRMTNGQKLGQFLERNDLRPQAAADALDVARPTVLAWIDGDKEPKHVHRKLIDLWTGGEVAYADWPSSREESRLFSAAVPFKAA